MLRKLRVEYPGAMYPVMSRGNRGKNQGEYNSGELRCETAEAKDERI